MQQQCMNVQLAVTRNHNIISQDYLSCEKSTLSNAIFKGRYRHDHFKIVLKFIEQNVAFVC